MLDLKAQLAAAGLVTQEQVKAIDEEKERERAAKLAKAEARRAASQNRGQNQRNHSPHKAHSNKKPGQNRSKNTRNNRGAKQERKGPDLKAMGRGEAYDRIRKIVAHSRLDDKERTIPLPDDQTFNFVTAGGTIGRLYLTEETVTSLKQGKTAISSFMSNHGLSHCVLPKAVALELAEVFPLWLRHLRGHEPLMEEPEVEEEVVVVEEPVETEEEKTAEPKTTEVGSETTNAMPRES